MAADIYLKIDGIDGESTDHQYTNHIEVMTYNHGVSQTATGADVRSTSGGGASARCNHMDMTITKLMDKASPQLSHQCCTGKHIPKVQLFLRRSAGEKPHTYMKYEMDDVVISSVNVSGASEGGVPTESVCFNYGKIKWEYTQQKADGSAGGKTTGSWDLEANKVQ